MRRRFVIFLATGAAALAAWALPAAAQTGEIRIAHVYSKTGPLQAYGRQTQTGLMMGLEYATGGTMQVAGKKLVVIEKDDEGKPELGKQLLEQAYVQDKADMAVGPTSSGVALAMLPVAQAHQKILLVEPAAADAITGEQGNRFIFRTGRSSSQDAVGNAVAVDKPGTLIATLAQDYAFGRDGVKAFKNALQHSQVVHEEYLPPNTTDFAASAQRLIDKLKAQPGRKLIFIIWAGAGNPFRIADFDLKRHGIEIATGGNTLPAMVAYNQLPGMEGATYYYFSFSKNQANLWLVTQHYVRHQGPPDFFTAGGFSAAMALVTALGKTRGETETNRLIATMEGMDFETPKGRMRFRQEDHQALQSMYHFRVAMGARPGTMADLYLVREIKPEDLRLPLPKSR
jgi:branched-chain amino acid transport system substrate-binding protein